MNAIVTHAGAAIDAAEKFGLRQPTLNGDLFAAAGPEDLEDLVALYLQEQGWRTFPSTAKVSMASYEFVLVHHETGHHAGVQVKSGGIGFLNQDVAQDSMSSLCSWQTQRRLWLGQTLGSNELDVMRSEHLLGDTGRFFQDDCKRDGRLLIRR